MQVLKFSYLIQGCICSNAWYTGIRFYMLELFIFNLIIAIREIGGSNMWEWIFDGIGTEIASLIIGASVGGFAGYKIGIKKNGHQKQVAKDDAHQKQELAVEVEVDTTGSAQDSSGVEGNLRQLQKAGNHAQQTQIGNIKYGKR